ncbi:uncharacterized protein B0H64DRAFT_87669 [Chaetomium fimeti]|uniref:Uncharacterized protein n=1 Tax=Chaetomium fimeti TaxID=1854472 RepID=A0AAE0HLZ6_9PEZI|nr:hypothetical protein B0H64DRAFT_87669 [Chaetomium fimeti]
MLGNLTPGWVFRCSMPRQRELGCNDGSREGRPPAWMLARLNVAALNPNNHGNLLTSWPIFPGSEPKAQGYSPLGACFLSEIDDLLRTRLSRSKHGQSSHDSCRWRNVSATRYFPSRRWAARPDRERITFPCGPPPLSPTWPSFIPTSDPLTQEQRPALPMGAPPCHVDGSSRRFQGPFLCMKSATSQFALCRPTCLFRLHLPSGPLYIHRYVVDRGYLSRASSAHFPPGPSTAGRRASGPPDSLVPGSAMER